MSGSSAGIGGIGGMDLDGAGGTNGLEDNIRNFGDNDSERYARIYKFSSNPPVGIKHYLMNKYSLKSLVLNKLIITGKMHIIATAVFKNKVDYEDALKFNVTIDGKEYTFEAVSKISEDDKNTPFGIYVPRRVKRVNLNYIPEHMATASIMKSVFAEYFDFEERFFTKIVDAKGCYTGRVVIMVSKFKKIPTKIKEIDYVDISTKNFTDISAKVQVEVLCSGFESDMDKEPIPKKICFYCKKEGHFIGSCVKLRQKQMVKICKICNKIDTCQKGKCVNLENIQNGILYKRPNKYVERQTLSEKIKEKINLNKFPSLASQKKRAINNDVKIAINNNQIDNNVNLEQGSAEFQETSTMANEEVGDFLQPPKTKIKEDSALSTLLGHDTVEEYKSKSIQNTRGILNHLSDKNNDSKQSIDRSKGINNCTQNADKTKSTFRAVSQKNFGRGFSGFLFDKYINYSDKKFSSQASMSHYVKFGDRVYPMHEYKKYFKLSFEEINLHKWSDDMKAFIDFKSKTLSRDVLFAKSINEKFSSHVTKLGESKGVPQKTYKKLIIDKPENQKTISLEEPSLWLNTCLN